jgi:hypothetical protein
MEREDDVGLERGVVIVAVLFDDNESFEGEKDCFGVA